jgi:hypothetical protein
LLSLVVLASFGLVAHLRSAKLQQSPTPKSTAPNFRAVSEGL